VPDQSGKHDPNRVGRVRATRPIAGIEAAHMIRKCQFGANGLSAFQQFAALAA